MIAPVLMCQYWLFANSYSNNISTDGKTTAKKRERSVCNSDNLYDTDGEQTGIIFAYNQNWFVWINRGGLFDNILICY